MAIKLLTVKSAPSNATMSHPRSFIGPGTTWMLPGEEDASSSSEALTGGADPLTLQATAVPAF
ncbi:MAG TPA: hypothetical protein VNM72_00295, partial [Blastocatellia bacterium]|nr:hypothetical protein [Blastocatellia bacterium]